MPGERTARSIGLQPRQSNAMLTFSCTITLRKNFFPGVALQILLMFVDFKSGCNDKRTFEKSENLTGTIVVSVKWRRGRTTPEGMIVAACLLCVQTGCSNRAGGEEARLIW